LIIDTHTHLYLEEFNVDRSEMIRRAQDKSVIKVLLPNIDSSSIESLLQMSRDYPEFAFPMMGLHPCSVKENYKAELNIIEKKLSESKFFGIGEIGLDLYWDKESIEIQKEAFVTQLQWSKFAKLPVSIHSRECTTMAIDIVEQMQDGDITGVFHCFGGSLEEGLRIKNLGMYLGIGGVLTYKNSNLKNILLELGYENLVLETDAPYLSPVPMRGKRNEPSYLDYVLELLSQIFSIDRKEMEEIIYQNSLKVFPELA
jgi:TatD DNase family protein